jgi:hypothetical protein
VGAIKNGLVQTNPSQASIQTIFNQTKGLHPHITSHIKTGRHLSCKQRGQSKEKSLSLTHIEGSVSLN